MRLAIAVCSVVILVSSSGGCDTSRDWAQIQAAAQAQADTVSNDNTLSLPPGYISGFEVTLRKDYTVLITGGSANVGGRQVTLSEDHQLTLQDWVAPRMDTPQHYYLYLSKDGNIYVDIVKPKFDSYYGYYQQPATGWRVIGKMFVQSTNIIYAIKDVSRSGRTVTVAPSDYVGYADYYCDGVSDEILINAAIQYEWAAYQGGTVQLLEGIFLTSSQINISYNNITFKGMGKGSWIKGPNTDYIITSAGTSSIPILNCEISSIKISSLNTPIATYPAIELNYSNYLRISNCYLTNVYTAIDLTNCSGSIIDSNLIDSFYSIGISNNKGRAKITNNIIDGLSVSRSTYSYGIIIPTNGSQDNTIQSNTIQNIATTSNNFFAIELSGPNNIVISNTIKNITSSDAANYVYGIRVNQDYNQLSDNYIDTLKNTGTTTNVIAIAINVGTSSTVKGNYCFNNGSDTAVANTNGNNYYDAGTSTQCFSNSWQSVTGTKALQYTPFTQGFGTTPTIQAFSWVRVANFCNIFGRLLPGTPTATEARLYLPSSDSQLISDASFITTLQICGIGGHANSAVIWDVLVEPSVSYVTFSTNGAAGGTFAKQNGNLIMVAGSATAFNFSVPIKGWNT
jgi:hypothetical protein